MSSIEVFEHLRIPLQAIKLATNNFDDNNYISRGGFGKVYKGELSRFGKSVTYQDQSTFLTNDDFTPDTPSVYVSQEEQYVKDTLAAYRKAADAAARIQAAFRAQSLKLRTKDVESSNKEKETRCIIAAMRIQHAFRNHERKKQMAAAAHGIQR
ncbi:hypothetical protein L6452_29088 [Arctium lappa]|uniref:Uncharacterized protein n=1 Tax=Arctium lappa TaxID=4217 RepID=A0ACB8ZH58_ARCLA|nr:hypothetical protein L6452_29088 [Arctium lappa]